MVIVDVLSFSTTVDVAASRGAAVIPYSGGYDDLETFATRVGAESGGRRGKSRYSLSPASFLEVPAGTRVVVRSINGGRLSEAVSSELTVSGCLRNASAVAAALSSSNSVLLVPAGEQWSDGSMRPCLEDWLGAGAIACRLVGERTPEAELAARAFEAAKQDLRAMLCDSMSGKYLVERGFARDVELAAELDVSNAVPALHDGAYVLAGV